MPVLISSVTSRSFGESLLTYKTLCGKRSRSLFPLLKLQACVWAPLFFCPLWSTSELRLFLWPKELLSNVTSSVWPTQKASSTSLVQTTFLDSNTIISPIVTRSKINLLPYFFQVLHICILQTKQSRDPTSSPSSFHWKPTLFPWGKVWFSLCLWKWWEEWIGGRRTWRESHTSMVPSLHASPSGKNKQNTAFWVNW